MFQEQTTIPISVIYITSISHSKFNCRLSSNIQSWMAG